MSARTAKRNASSTKITKAQRAGVVTPPSRVHRHLKHRQPDKRIGKNAAIYFAGVLDYLIAEVVELAGSRAKAEKRKRVTPTDISRAISNDEELKALMAGVYIPGTRRQMALPDEHLPKHLQEAKKRRAATKAAQDLMDTSEEEEPAKQKKANKTKTKQKKAPAAPTPASEPSTPSMSEDEEEEDDDAEFHSAEAGDGDDDDDMDLDSNDDDDDDEEKEKEDSDDDLSLSE